MTLFESDSLLLLLSWIPSAEGHFREKPQARLGPETIVVEKRRPLLPWAQPSQARLRSAPPEGVPGHRIPVHWRPEAGRAVLGSAACPPAGASLPVPLSLSHSGLPARSGAGHGLLCGGGSTSPPPPAVSSSLIEPLPA